MRTGSVKFVLKIVITAVVLLLIAFVIKKNINELRIYDFSLDISSLILSFLVLIFSNLILAYIWFLITRNLLCNLGFFESVRLRLVSEIGKYFPGRVLGYGYLILKYKEAGKDQIRVLNSSVYELFLSTFSSFLFFSLMLLFTSFQLLNRFKFIFFIISIAGVIALHPWFFQKVSDLFCRAFKKEKILYKVSYTDTIKLLAFYLLYWLIFSFGFFYFVKAFTEVSSTDLVYLSGAFAISAFAGFLAFFIPAGLGAREGLLIYLLASVTGNTMAIIISLASRLWIIVVDLLLWGTSALSFVSIKKLN